MRLRATRLTAASNPRRRLLDPARLFQTAGRVGVCYTSDTGGVSWDDLIAENMRAIAAGTPHLAPLTHDSAATVPVVYPIAAGQGLGFLRDRSAGSALGAELVTNGTFDTALTGWTFNSTRWVWESGRARSVPDTFDSIRQECLTPDTWVRVSFEIGGATNAGRVEVRTNIGTSSSGTTTIGIFSVGNQPGGYTFTLRVPSGHTALHFFPTLDAANTSGSRFNGWIDNISVRELPGYPLSQPTLSARGEFSRRYNKLLATATLATQSVTTIATTYRLLFSGAGTVTLSGTATGTLSAGSHTITATAGTLTLTVSGAVTEADLRFSADAHIGKPYQRVTSASNYDEEGYPTYLRRQTDDWARAFAVNPNGATKALCFWAGQKMSDAATGVLFETSVNATTNNGAVLHFQNGASSLTGFGALSRGTASGSANVNARPAPNRYVSTTKTSVSAPLVSLSLNGVLEAVNTASSQGTGTYLTYDLFEGARAGTSLFANTRTYTPPMLMFIQPADPGPTDSEIARLENKFKRAAGVL
jgi:hypothetical protein